MITKTQLDQIIKREAEKFCTERELRCYREYGAVPHGILAYTSCASLLAPALLEAIESLEKCRINQPYANKYATEVLERINKMLGK